MEVRLGLWLTRILVHILASKTRTDFSKSLDNPRLAQDKVLKEILKLSGQDKLPESATLYCDYPVDQSWTAEAVKFYEVTSGSS